ncbi:MAG: choice-of-anchor J domain-containing protein [Bacteroidales bacterium]|nr:choice-of-anchor J domain-containing protein [Bacteroidales bacterium]
MKKLITSFLGVAVALGAYAADVRVVPVSRAMLGGDVGEVSTVGSGHMIERLVSNKSGELSTAIVGNAFDGSRRKVSAAASAPVRVSKADGCVLYEDFEGATANYIWMPDGWTRECRDEKSHSVNDEGFKATWTVSSYMPHDGKYSARVQIDFMLDDNGDLVFGKSHYQDEWLYTPVFTPGATDVMSFYFGYRPGRTLYNADTNKFDAVNNVTEMYISSDGGETYEKVWDCLEYARTLSVDELWADCATVIATYINVSMSMAEYAGKPVKVAFRYFGQNGESAMIDDFKVGRPDVRALYEAPLGTFFAGYDDSFNQVLAGHAIAPTCGENSWENLSSKDSNQFDWSLSGYGGGQLASSDERNLVFTPHGYVIGHQPVLTASALGADDSAYAFGGADGYVTAFGGNCDDLIEYLTNHRPASPVGAAVYDIDAYGITNWGVFGGGTEFNERASMTAYLKGYDALAALGVGQFFQQPAHPYYITRMDWFAENVVCDPDAVYTLSLSKVVDGAPTADTYAIGTAYGRDIEMFEKDGRTIFRLPFKFVDDSGRPVKVVIDGSMYAFLDLADPRVSNFEMLAQKVPSETGFAYGYYEYAGLFDLGDGEYIDFPEMESMRQTVDPEAGPLYCSFFVQTDATYPWLHSDATDLGVSGDGGTYEIEIDSYAPVADWTIDAPAWLHCTLVEKNDGSRVISIVADRGEGQPRSADVVVSAPAAELAIAVSQGASGVADVESEDCMIGLVGTELMVGCPGAVDVFTPAGVHVLSAVADGSSPISVAHLTSGIYIAKCGSMVVRIAVR